MRRGIGRHVVRFVDLDGAYYALKELPPRLAEREYRLLGDLAHAGVPAVEAIGVVSQRVDDAGEELAAIVITRVLEFSLALPPDPRPEAAAGAGAVDPRRSRRAARPPAPGRVLLGRLLALERALRRDAAPARWRDEAMEPRGPAVRGAFRFRSHASTSRRVMTPYASHCSSPWRSGARGAAPRSRGRARATTRTRGPAAARSVRAGRARLDGVRRIEPRSTSRRSALSAARRCGSACMQVVEPGHHRRRLLHLTGLDARENQARRLLNDITAFARTSSARAPHPSPKRPRPGAG